MRRGTALLGTLVMALGALALPLGAATAVTGGQALVVIVHPSRTDALGAQDLARIYLRTRRFWDDGSPIVPLNREPGSTEREAFSVRVFAAESAYLAGYWNAQYFHGVFPPTVLASSAAVKRYVATDRNAIGYIDASEVDLSVRVLLTLESGEPAEPPR